MNQQLNEIKEALSKATPGPWRVETEHDLWKAIKSGHGFQHTMVADCVHARDAELFAHAPEWLASLVAEVERLNYIIAVMEADSNNVYAGCGKFHRENKEMQKTLDWYADDDNWTRTTLRHGTEWLEPGPANADEGERARQALQSLKGDKP